jgi:hypothetical protein
LTDGLAYNFTYVVLRAFILVFLSISCCWANGDIHLGIGYNNATGGRIVPSLNLGLGTGTFEVLLSSTGVSTKAYSHSAYSLGGYWTRSLGDFLFGKIESGYGFGGIYAYRTFKDLNSAEEKRSDFAIGPAFFSRWFLASPGYISVEAILGLGNPGRDLGDMLGMNVRDQVNFAVGVQF